MRTAQQAEREEKETRQAQLDEQLWREHEAANFRDWEQWEVMHCPPSRGRRLQACLTFSHGSVAADKEADEYDGPREDSSVTGASGVPTSVGAKQEDNKAVTMFRKWRHGLVPDEEVTRTMRSDMLANCVLGTADG